MNVTVESRSESERDTMKKGKGLYGNISCGPSKLKTYLGSGKPELDVPIQFSALRLADTEETLFFPLKWFMRTTG